MKHVKSAWFFLTDLQTSIVEGNLTYSGYSCVQPLILRLIVKWLLEYSKVIWCFFTAVVFTDNGTFGNSFFCVSVKECLISSCNFMLVMTRGWILEKSTVFKGPAVVEWFGT